MDSANAISLLELARRLGAAVSEAAICDVWVTAETSDLRCSGGHCYMELIQKDPQSGATVARLRATCSDAGARFCSALPMKGLPT